LLTKRKNEVMLELKTISGTVHGWMVVCFIDWWSFNFGVTCQHFDQSHWTFQILNQHMMALIKNWILSFEVLLAYESVDRSTFCMKGGSASLKKQPQNQFIVYNLVSGYPRTSICVDIYQHYFQKMFTIISFMFQTYRRLFVFFF